MKGEDSVYILLYDYVKKHYFKLVSLEDEKQAIIDQVIINSDFTSLQRLKMDSLLDLQQKVADDFKIPLYILAKGDSNGVREVVTNIELYSQYPGSFDIAEISSETFSMYCDDSYGKKINRFMKVKKFSVVKEKVKHFGK